MEELLTAREDLVQKYFMKEKFCDSDYLSMHQEFNTTQRPSIPETYRTSGLLSNVFISKPNFQCCFNSVQINLITHSINEAHLFSIEVSEKEANDLFFCCLKHPLKSACNRRVAFFFDALCEYKLISARWQHVIEKNELIQSSAKDVFLNGSKLSTALNEAKQNSGCVYKTIKLWVQKIAEYSAQEECNPKE